jgi:hypothetical protein
MMLNIEPVSGSVNDVVYDVGMMSGVDPKPITVIVPTDHAPSITLKFMSQDDATFGDEQAEDLADDRLVPKLSNRDKISLQCAMAEHATDVPDSQDMS